MPTRRFMAFAARLSDSARDQRRDLLLDMLHGLPGGRRRVIDLGGRAAYWRAMGLEKLRGLGVHVTLVNLEQERVPPAEADLFSFLHGDACSLPDHADDSFDFVHSNSVIEHVGGRARRQAFASEVRRLAPAYFVQTPYFYFPVEPHFLSLGFHWLPERVKIRRLMRQDLGHHRREATVESARATVRSARLQTGQQMRELFPDATIVHERLFGLVKSLIAIRRARDS